MSFVAVVVECLAERTTERQRKMKKIMLSSVLILGAASLPQALFALDAPFSTDAPPTQSYRSLDAAANINVAKSISATAATTPAAPAEQPLVTTPTIAGGAAINPSPDSVDVDLNLQTQMGVLSQTVSAFEQQTEQHIGNLNDSNHAIAASIETMTQTISTLQQQVAVLQQADSKNTTAISTPKTFAEYTGFGAGAIFMIGFGAVLGRVSRRTNRAKSKNMSASKTPKMPKMPETHDEYDFMETAEAIPTLLDLARSYLVMQDIEQAKTILKTVIEKGNAEQRTEAQSLMNKIIVQKT